MKGKAYNQKRLELYDTEIMERFLWLPHWLPIGSKDGPIQWRWLERAKILQEVGKNLWGELLWFDRYWVEENGAV